MRASTQAAPLHKSRVTRPEARESALAHAQFNTNLLPQDAVEIDLMTDSGAERPSWFASMPTLPLAQLESFIRGLYGYKHLISVLQGRIAEAIVAAALSRPGTRILTNSIFPTAYFHLASRGSVLLDISAGPGSSCFDSKFQANLDLEKLQQQLDANVACVWIEACSNASFGAPVSLENVRAIHTLCATQCVPVVIDASRLLENVLMYSEHAASPISLAQTLRDYCAHADVLVMSGTKDFCVQHGGYIGTNNTELFSRLADISMAFGANLASAGSVPGVLPSDPFEPARERLKSVRNLHRELKDEGILTCQENGGHAVFIDVRRVLPEFPEDGHAVPAFLNALYKQCGARGGEHFNSIQQNAEQRRIVRLAIPVMQFDSSALLRVSRAIATIHRRSRDVMPLQAISAAAGIAGKFSSRYAPRGQ
jgi:tryptophanase